MEPRTEARDSRDVRDESERAQRFLRRLVDRRGVVLRPGTRVREVARKLARVWDAVTSDRDEAGGVLCAWLLEQEEVEDLPAGELEIGALALD
jgi:hypothetical protein